MAVWGLALGAIGLAPGAWAQDRTGLTRPADERPVVPSFLPEPRARGRILPPVGGGGRAVDRVPEGDRIPIPGIRIVGNTVLPDAVLRDLAAPLVGRSSTFEELLDLRDRITMAYASRGYVTSGSLLPRRADDGAIEFAVVEGALEGVDIETDGRLRTSYLERRLRGATVGAVNVERLEERLQLMQQDQRIRAVRATLLPGAERGRSRLQLAVQEARAIGIDVEQDNGLSPAVGADHTRVRLRHANLLGFADDLRLEMGRSKGLSELSVRYAIPLGASDTLLELRARGSSSEVVEDGPIALLDIEGRSATYGISLRQPVYQSLGDRLAVLDLSLQAEYRRSKSFVAGRGFGFAAESDGEAEVAVLRFGQDFTWASRRQVLALRSVVSVGLDAAGATVRSGADVPDGRFVAWLGQAQWARRVRVEALGIERDVEVVARADVQLSRDPLLGLEQFAVGGRTTVRGYRENEVVTDNGIVGSLELRVPLLRRPDGSPIVSLVPFVDAARAWNARGARDVRRLLGAGLGLRMSLGNRLFLEVYCADDLRELDVERSRKSPQDRGIHFRVTGSY